MEKMIPWFDLSAYGAALKIIPKNNLRDRAFAVLVVSDSQRAFAQLKADAEAQGQPLEGSEVTERFHNAANALGFGRFIRRSVFTDGGDEIVLNESTNNQKSEFSLSEIRSLFPSVSQASVVPTPLSAIRYVEAIDVSPHLEGWTTFAENCLENEMGGVWISDADLETPTYDGADPLLSMRDAYLRQGMNSITRIGLHELESEDRLRANAFVRYYYSKAEAIAGGVPEEQAIEASFPYGMPFMTARDGGVALRDFRVAKHAILANDPDYLVPIMLRQFPRLTRANEREQMTYREAAEQAFLAATEGDISADLVSTAHARLEALCFKSVEMWPQASRESDGTKASQLLFSKTNPSQHLYELLRSTDLLYKSDRGLSQVHVRENFALQPLAFMNEEQVDSMVRLMHPPMVDPDEARVAALRGAVSRLVGHQKALEEEALAAKVKAELLSVSSKVASSSESKAKLVIDDAGEKIGGARKDYAKRAMSAAELPSMTDLERKELVVKGNVWAGLDYKAMRDEGLSPQFALSLKTIKDLINVKPIAADVDTQREYIEAVGMVRDALMPCKTTQELGAALYDLYFKCLNEDPAEPGVMVERIRSTIYDSQYPAHKALGNEFCRLMADAADYSPYHPETGARLPAKNYIFSAKMPHTVARIIAKKMPSQTRDYVNGEFKTIELTSDDHWKVLIKSSKVKSDLEVDEAQKKRDIDRHLHRVHLENVTREGEDWRQGKNIMPEDLMEHFGFRAVEFGKWLPQDERQDVLNFAFDSFCDLANVLQIPPKDVSFDGKLAIAFGSRGTGGAKAALAHFEPARFVINLTRLNGAGSLAHEWFHALDFHMGSHKGYMSEDERPEFAELASPLQELLKAMKRRETPISNAIQIERSKFDQHLSYAVSWVRYDFRHTLPSSLTREEVVSETAKFVGHLNSIATDAQTRMKEIFKAEMASPEKIGSSIGGHSEQLANSFLEAALSPFKKLKKQNSEQLYMNTRSFSRALERACLLEAADECGLQDHISIKAIRGRDNSSFLQNAEKLDKMRSKPYWATTLEMFARAGECYVFDRLNDAATHCDYLVHGVAETTYESSDYGNPYPQKGEREAINKGFDALMAAYRSQLQRERALSVDEDADPSPVV